MKALAVIAGTVTIGASEETEAMTTVNIPICIRYEVSTITMSEDAIKHAVEQAITRLAHDVRHKLKLMKGRL